MRRQNVFGRPKKKRYGKLIIIIIAVLVFQVSSVLYLSNIEYDTEATYESISIDPPGDAKVAWPIDGQSAIGTTSHGLLESKNENTSPVPIASITKLFTALAIVKKKPVKTSGEQNKIVFTSSDVWSYTDYLSQGGAVVPIAVGQEMTEYEALQAMLIPSANNMADTLAVWAFGSMDAYLEYVNKMVRNMGMVDTKIADASGFSPESVSTPKDLIKLGQAAASDPVISSIIRRPYTDLPNTGRIYNTNKLLGTNGIIGGKTGNTPEAGDCLLFIANHTSVNSGSQTIIGVVLGQQSSRPETFNRANSLLNSTKKGFVKTTLIKKGQSIGTYKTAWDREIDILANDSIKLNAWKDTPISPDIWIKDAVGSMPAGDKVGSLVVQSGDDTFETSLSIEEQIEKPSILWRLSNLLTYH